MAVLPARTGFIPSHRGSRAPGGGLPVIVPVPPAGPSEAPVRAAVPTRGGRVPAPRDSAEAGGKPAEAESVTEAVTEAETVTEVVAGTTVDHLTETYQAHYRSLLGLAALLLDDTASCEDVVQEAFIRVHSARNRVRDRDKTLAYLRQTVVNLSRSALRRRILGLKLLSKPMPDMASAEEGAYDQLERDDLIKAMRGLQRRQREVLVLRYFADMTEAQVAETLGVSLGSVKAYGSRGIAALRVAMEAAQS
ncbi:SigE family RNA polymerase sigma factor [Streptomyces sp. NBC_01546]|uniref:SigE family RNA polymerase sigma factor n=1 Tax=Streptomyces sp. NBC_00047 TaxID=2975627 RepID=UPI00224E3593|nr:SigE family RNA polymerase sigma factor [Streptomyces sp. NBC_00047]MCX5607121.1 SigE family RNA polymerase sigma factor [Streptomyces sp. NBC_00047]